jgi:hypothetical protein
MTPQVYIDKIENILRDNNSDIAKKKLRVLKKEINLTIRKIREFYKRKRAHVKRGEVAKEVEESVITSYLNVLHRVDVAILELDKAEIRKLEREKSLQIKESNINSELEQKRELTGGVYLLKSGQFYKIGKAIFFDERIKQIKLLQPEPVEIIHKIYTSDPDGIERYWHRRFSNRRKNGEWFELSITDVDEFKRWYGGSVPITV